MSKKTMHRLTAAPKYTGISGWVARKKSYKRTIVAKSFNTWPYHVINQLRANTWPTSDLVEIKIGKSHQGSTVSVLLGKRIHPDSASLKLGVFKTFPAVEVAIGWYLPSHEISPRQLGITLLRVWVTNQNARKALSTGWVYTKKWILTYCQRNQ